MLQASPANTVVDGEIVIADEHGQMEFSGRCR